MKRYLILLMAVIFASASCTTPRYVSREPSMKTEWVGRSHADIVRSFGIFHPGQKENVKDILDIINSYVRIILIIKTQ